MLVRIKTVKKKLQQLVMKTEKKTEKKQQQSWKKKDELGVEFVCLRHDNSTKNNVNKTSLTVFEATELDCSMVF